jgi:hypothetical protein
MSFDNNVVARVCALFDWRAVVFQIFSLCTLVLRKCYCCNKSQSYRLFKNNPTAIIYIQWLCIHILGWSNVQFKKNALNCANKCRFNFQQTQQQQRCNSHKLNDQMLLVTQLRLNINFILLLSIIFHSCAQHIKECSWQSR